MRRITDYAGTRFGRLTAVRRSSRSNKKRTFWECVCDCGNVKTVDTSHLRGGNVTSCGCRRQFGVKNFPEYSVWTSMKSRCQNPRYRKFPDYGGRGITICKRWNDSFSAFLADMGPRPSSDHSIDRIDNDGNYEPGNCRWATRSQQAMNRRGKVLYEYNGRSLTMTEWAKELGVPRCSLGNRIALGMTISQVMDKPIKRYRTRP